MNRSPTASGDLHVLTGAFGYSGKYIAGRLLAEGHRVRTLTNSIGRANPFGDRIEVRPLAFDAPDRLAASLEGATVLYNTYWIRFNHGSFTRAQAVENTLALFDAARRAGVRRIVHVSITNPSEQSPFEYFRCKAYLERALALTGVPHTILRPAVFFGGADILINNIAWMLRHLPVIGIFGSGSYRLQPIHVEDFAGLAVQGGRASDNRIIDATGPETFTYRQLVVTIGDIIGRARPLLRVPPAWGHGAAAVLGWLLHDVVLTRDEIDALMADLLATGSPPAGTTRLTDWARRHADRLGRHYAGELARRRNRDQAYELL